MLSNTRSLYMAKKKEFDSLINQLEDTHASKVFLVNQGKIKWAQESRVMTRNSQQVASFLSSVEQSISRMKEAQQMERRNAATINEWVKILTSEECLCRRSAYYQQLLDDLTPLVEMSQNDETLYNRMINEKNVLFEFMKTCDLMKERVHIVANDCSMLITDFMRYSIQPSEGESYFERYFMVAKSKKNECLDTIQEYGALIKPLNNTVINLKRSLSANTLFQKRYKLLKQLDKGLTAYDVVLKYYKENIPKTDNNIARINNVLHSLEMLHYPVC